MKFIYNNKIYNPVDLNKKLKKLRITIDDIEIIKESKNPEQEKIENICLFYFKKDNLKRCSIYPEKNGWEEISKEEYNM